jgi:fructose-bisphosphate aldolase class II
VKIISDRRSVLSRLKMARTRRVPILSPNAETPDEMEAILLAAQQFAVETNSARVTMGIGITAGYPDHPQLVRLHPLARWQGARPDAAATPKGGLLPVALRWLDWLDSYKRDPWFNRVEVIPFWDHGWVPIEAQLLTNAELVKRMGIIFFDASALPFEENVKLTAAYVARFRSQVVIEGCPDKIASQAEIQAATDLEKHSALSKPAQVREFVRRTGVDLVVPSLGTEHRGLPGESIRYRTALARRLRAENGDILVLHGTSSLGDRISAVGRDGIVKVNFYTGAARSSGAALRNAWATQPTPLPIEAAAGSFVHATRREAFRSEVLALLKRLKTPRKIQRKKSS